MGKTTLKAWEPVARRISKDGLWQTDMLTIDYRSYLYYCKDNFDKCQILA